MRNAKSGLVEAARANRPLSLLYRNSPRRMTLNMTGRGQIADDPAVRERVWALSPEVEKRHDPDRKGAVVWKTGVFTKPPEATGQIVWGGTADDASVKVVDAAGKVTVVPVRVNQLKGLNWLVTRGLKGGERVVVENTAALEPGAIVTPRERAVEKQPDAQTAART